MDFQARIFIIILLLTGSTIFPSPAFSTAAKPTVPKVGECYLLSIAQIFNVNSVKKPLNCRETHSVETYKVAKWAGPEDLNKLDELQRRDPVSVLCQPEKIISTDFTTWSYKVPTPAQWKAGARWIRCDAFSVSPEDPGIVITYKGKKLKSK